MVKIKNKFELDRTTELGMDSAGKLYCRCLNCQNTMTLIGFVRDKTIKNKYVCSVCKKVRVVSRHWN